MRAAVVAPGDELRPGRRVGGLAHQSAPVLAGLRGQRILLTLGGPGGSGLAGVDQAGAAGLVTVGQQAFGDGG